jgi:hypothetical protein
MHRGTGLPVRPRMEKEVGEHRPPDHERYHCSKKSIMKEVEAVMHLCTPGPRKRLTKSKELLVLDGIYQQVYLRLNHAL